jgi:hypothetical protein
VKWGRALLAEWGFDGLAAAGVELEQVVDLVLGLGRGRGDETGRSGRLGTDVGLAGDKLEQVEGDIFGAARCRERDGFHGFDGSGWRMRAQTGDQIGKIGFHSGFGWRSEMPEMGILRRPGNWLLIFNFQ